jgi:glycosyltransferase involved in cell wall biosynthesis
MRILHVTPTFWPATRYGGPIVSTRALVAALAARGHDVWVATTSVDGPTDRRELEATPRALDGATVLYFPAGQPRRIYRSPAMARWLTAHARDFDVVHAHAAFLWPTWMARRVTARHGIPWIHSPRGMLVADLIRQRSTTLKRLWIALIERGNVARATAVHFTSAHEARAFGELGLRARRQEIIPNGVHWRSPDHEGHVEKDPRLIAYVGRLSWEKRVDRLLDALPGMPAARLVVAGHDGGDGMQAALAAHARELGVADQVRFAGSLGPDDVARLLQRASILVLPSLSESFGNVVTEAMAHGCAVAVAPGVGAREVVEACGAGAVIEPEPAALAALLGQWIADPQGTRERGERGRRFVRERLAWPRIAEAMERLYLSLSDPAWASPPGVAPRRTGPEIEA